MSYLQSLPTPGQAALDVLRRRNAKESLTAFIDYISELEGGIQPARHHRLLIEKLEAVERGEIPRLMVFMPPGSAKSTYANRIFGAWYMGRNPGKLLITASHNDELAKWFGRRTRKIADSTEFKAVFDAGLDPSSAAADQWALTSGSEYFATSVGGSVTGRRADGAIIDDPVKGREEADSETIRRKTVEWYKSDLWTRLKPGAFVILIMTRWHELDLAGVLLADMAAGGEPWEVLSIPAVAEENDPLGRPPGEPLWPEWFTRPAQVVLALPAASGARRRRLLPARLDALVQQGPDAETHADLRRLGLCDQRGQRRLHGPRRDRRRSQRRYLHPRPVATADDLGCLDRGHPGPDETVRTPRVG
jgi:hypothetical protein